MFQHFGLKFPILGLMLKLS